MRKSAEGALLARAYELHQNTDLTYREIERALEIRSGTLKRSIEKAMLEPRLTCADEIYNLLLENGEMREREIIMHVDSSMLTIKKAIYRLKADGRIVKAVCRVDRRMSSYKVKK